VTSGIASRSPFDSAHDRAPARCLRDPVRGGLPLLVGILAMVGAISSVIVLANSSYQSIFAINIITLLGLALGVDYSLFMVARFREEMRKHPIETALSNTLSTTGKAILFSGITVIFGLAATLFFPIPRCARWAWPV